MHLPNFKVEIFIIPLDNNFKFWKTGSMTSILKDKYTKRIKVSQYLG